MERRIGANQHYAENGTSRDDEPLTETAIFQLLGNERRRLVVDYLLQNGDATRRELAEHVAEAEGAENERAYKSVYVSLHQTHLPKLEVYGVVRFDEGAGALVPGANAWKLAPYLAVSSRRWEIPLIALTILNVVLFSVSVLGLL
ncbi:DUF7344 domain-containing protein [Halegenticoccus soli]|uniref:DUF7344 domain-containing protein n=1 Tax=Halegenticoccus soli TaxID=1985678 RepID=UPI001304055F|nr:hypothetical protein [Halegenticoccus soli]